jgi:very-short-patch-repair endonuclease
MNEKEKILWLLLKDKNYSGLKFKRQHQIGKYVLDFYCEERKIAIELEVNTDEDKNNSYHSIRKDFFRINGIKVIKLPESSLQSEIKHLLNKILYKKRKTK